MISRDSKAAINREASLYTPKTCLLSQVAEARDKSGADSQSHSNWLVTRNLMTAIAPVHKAGDERAVVLEAMSSLAILQPHTIAGLIPDLPPLIMRELRLGLGSTDGQRYATPVAAALPFLASAVHTSPLWLHQYWTETAQLMADCISAGEALPVLKGIDVVLNAVSE